MGIQTGANTLGSVRMINCGLEQQEGAADFSRRLPHALRPCCTGSLRASAVAPFRLEG